MAWAVSALGGNTLYSDWGSAMSAQYGSGWYKGGKRQKAAESQAQADWKKDRELQDKEFNVLAGATKTVNYGSAITNPSDVSGVELTIEEEQAKAALALQEEEELLGQRLTGLGGTSLFGAL